MTAALLLHCAPGGDSSDGMLGPQRPVWEPHSSEYGGHGKKQHNKHIRTQLSLISTEPPADGKPTNGKNDVFNK